MFYLLTKVFLKTKFVRELYVKTVETKWHGAVLDLIIMPNGMSWHRHWHMAASRGGALLGDSL
jgi:hypothetical protein